MRKLSNTAAELNKTMLIKRNKYLKFVSAIFIYSPNESPSKTMENYFYFIKKALFILMIFS